MSKKTKEQLSIELEEYKVKFRKRTVAYAMERRRLEEYKEETKEVRAGIKYLSKALSKLYREVVTFEYEELPENKRDKLHKALKESTNIIRNVANTVMSKLDSEDTLQLMKLMDIVEDDKEPLEYTIKKLQIEENRKLT